MYYNMRKILSFFMILLLPVITFAGEADLVIPEEIKSQSILYWGFLITFAGFMFGLYQFMQVKKIRAHKSMLDVAQVIFETAKIYLIQQGKFLVILFLSQDLKFFKFTICWKLSISETLLDRFW